jgi:hypothetical protein
MEIQSNVCSLGKPLCAGRCTRAATSPPVTLHIRLFLVILFLCTILSAAVFWFAFVWSPFWAVLSPFWGFVWGFVCAFVCAFPPSVEEELFSVVAAWVTTTQFPSPAAVTKDTRQRFLSLPPAHLMPSGSLTASCCVPWLAGS